MPERAHALTRLGRKMMRIVFERTGGLMGRKIGMSLNLADLPPDQAGTLKRLVDESNFFKLKEIPPTSPSPDGFTYSITVETEKNQRTIHASETNLPQALRPLIDYLQSLARSH